MVELDFANEAFSFQCFDWEWYKDCTSCPEWGGQITQSTQSCTGEREQLPGQGFRLRAEVSADGEYLFIGMADGDVEGRFEYTLPYSLYRRVTVEQASDNGRPGEQLVFPVVDWQVMIDVSGEVEVDGNAGPSELAFVKKVGLIVDGARQTILYNPDTGNNNELTVYDDGRRIIDTQYIHAMGRWEAPDVSGGETLVLDSYTCGSGMSPQVLEALCTAAEEGVTIYYQSLEGHQAGAWGDMRAWSQGVVLTEPIVVGIDGGEALACFGKNSTMSSFGTRCDSEGITVSVEPLVTETRTYDVLRRGPNTFFVSAAMGPVVGPISIPVLSRWSLVLLLLVLGSAGVIGSRLRR